MSVIELGTLKVRLQKGREAKAKRGDLGRCLAPGYVLDATSRIVKDPNLRVQEAIALVFRRFEVLGSVRQTHRWYARLSSGLGGGLRVRYSGGMRKRRFEFPIPSSTQPRTR